MLASMPKDATKRTVTDENLAEAARLRRLWDAKEGRLSQLRFGEEFDIGNQSAVGFFLNGDSALSLKAAKGFANGLGCVIGDFSPRLAAEIGELAAAAGIGWPFPLVDRARWDRLTAEQRAYAQGVFNQTLSELQPGKPRVSLVQEGLQRDTKPGQPAAHSRAAPAHLTADEASSIERMAGGSKSDSHQNQRVEGKGNRRGPARTPRKS